MHSVSVVVPVFNGASTIGDMLQALVHQSGKPASLEIIVVDNGSTDETRAIVERFGVTLLAEPKRGPGAARNCGLRHAGGDLIAHLDADTLPTRNWLREIVAPFVDPDVLLVGGQTRAFRPETPSERYTERIGMYDTQQHVARLQVPFAASLTMSSITLLGVTGPCRLAKSPVSSLMLSSPRQPRSAVQSDRTSASNVQ